MDALPEITVADSEGVAGIDAQTARTIARDVLVDLRAESEALRARDLDGASEAASGAWLASLWDRIRGATGGPIAVPSYQVAHVELSLRRGAYQGPPTVVADLEGTVVVSTHGQGTRELVARADPQSFRRTLALVLEGQRYLIVGSTGGVTGQAATALCLQRGRISRRHALRRRRLAGRSDLPARRVPLRDVHGCDGDDGRRPLLARLRQRRLARSVRRQLVRRRRHRRLRGTRRAPAERALPERRRALRGRELTHRRRPSPPRQRLRRGRPEPRRPHGSLRHERRLQRAHRRLRRACCGTTATARSRKGPRRRASPLPAGTPRRRSETSTATAGPTSS